MKSLEKKLRLINDDIEIVEIVDNALLVKRCEGFSEFITFIYKGDFRESLKSLCVKLNGDEKAYKERKLNSVTTQVEFEYAKHKLKVAINNSGRILDVINCFKKDKYEVNERYIMIKREAIWAKTQIAEDRWIDVIKYGEDNIEFKYPKDMKYRVCIKDTDGNLVYTSSEGITMCGEFFIANKEYLFDIQDGERYNIDSRGDYSKLEQIQSGVYMKHNYPKYFNTGITGATVVDINNNKVYKDVTVYKYNADAGIIVLKKCNLTVIITEDHKVHELTGKTVVHRFAYEAFVTIRDNMGKTVNIMRKNKINGEELKQERIEQFKDTVEFFSNNVEKPYNTIRSINETKIYTGDTKKSTCTNRYDTKYKVQSLSDEGTKLNFVYTPRDFNTAVWITGGYSKAGDNSYIGVDNLESLMCRMTNLYNIEKEFNEYFEWNSKNKNVGIYYNRGLFIPYVIPKTYSKNELTGCYSVIKCALPIIGEHNYNQFKTIEEISELYRDRVKFAVDIAIKNNKTSMVIGLDSISSSEADKIIETIIEETKGIFESITFVTDKLKKSEVECLIALNGGKK